MTAPYKTRMSIWPHVYWIAPPIHCIPRNSKILQAPVYLYPYAYVNFHQAAFLIAVTDLKFHDGCRSKWALSLLKAPSGTVLLWIGFASDRDVPREAMVNYKLFSSLVLAFGVLTKTYSPKYGLRLLLSTSCRNRAAMTLTSFMDIPNLSLNGIWSRPSMQSLKTSPYFSPIRRSRSTDGCD